MMVPDPLPVTVKMRPMVLLSGFLGAGKTTFLRSLLEHLPNQRLSADVILNDYENADLDAGTLQEKAASIAPLSSSCACCSGLEDLVQLALTAQLTRSDLLLIELNGTADPIPLLESFTLLEQKLRFRPRWQIAIIDGRHLGKRGFYDDLEARQIETASHYVVSHLDSISKVRREEVQAKVRLLNPYATKITAARLSTHLATAVADAAPMVFPGKEPVFPGNSHRHGHRLSHAFTGCQILLPARVRKSQVMNWLTALPQSVIRAKALVTLIEEPGCRKLYERVGQNDFPKPAEVPVSGKVPPSAICIGPGLDPEALLILTREFFGPNVSLPDAG